MSTGETTPPAQFRIGGDDPSRRVLPSVHVAGLSLLFLVPGMLVSALIEWFYADQYSNNEVGLLVAAMLTTLIGGLMFRTTRVDGDMKPASVFSSVAFTWIACSIVGALPYVLGDMFPWSHFDDALFESASGFSATGSTVLSDIEANGRGVLIWRQFTQWYGGMGMVVLAVTVLPVLGVGGLSLMSAEAPGHKSDRLTQRASETARQLWMLYCGVTLAVMIALLIAPGPDLYDSFAHGLTTAATGGFSTYNASIGHYDSVLIEMILVVAMIFCGVNFTLHYRALKFDFAGYRRASDLHWYFSMIAGGIAITTLINWSADKADFATSLRHSVFNIATLASSTGFGNATDQESMGNFVTWAPAAQVILLMFMVVGGNVGSTAGGMKVFRFEVAMSHLVRHLQVLRRPRRISAVKLGKEAIPDAVVSQVLAFIGIFFSIAITGTLIVTALGGEFITSASAIISAMSNMGPALGEAGPTANFTQAFSRPARMVIAAHMLIGRLELFAMLLMFASIARTLRRRKHAFLKGSAPRGLERSRDPIRFRKTATSTESAALQESPE